MRVTAKVTRSGRYWAIEVPEVPIYTQSRRLNEVVEMATDAVAVALEVDPSTVEVTQVDVDASEVKALLAARESVAEAQESLSRASKNLDAAVVQMTASGYTGREMATVLDISPQRVHQLVRRAAI